MIILDVLVASNKTLNQKIKGVITPPIVLAKAKENINICTVLLMKGYALTQDLDAIMAKYKKLKKVPDMQTHAGKNVTPEVMQDLYEECFPRIPKNHLIMIMVQYFGDEKINFIHNGQRGDVVSALENLAKQMEVKKIG